jgi:hypothetical protein
MAVGATTPTAFPYPGRYDRPSDPVECTLSIDGSGAFEMEGMHCAFPEAIERRFALIQFGTGQARVLGDHLILDYTEPAPAGGEQRQDFLVVRCEGGMRLVLPDEQETVAMATHAADPFLLHFRGGFTQHGAKVGGNCDPRPLPPDLARLANAPPISAVVQSVGASRCHWDEDAYDCWATLRIDRGSRAGIVPGMSVYFTQCSEPEAQVMTVSEVGADSASIEANSRPMAEARPESLVGVEVTTRIPACQAFERDRIEREPQEPSP